MTRQLVVDADVLMAAGDLDEAPVPSGECRRFLRAIYEIGHRAVLGPTLDREWREHASNFSRAWRVNMMKRGYIVQVDGRYGEAIAAVVAKSKMPETRKAAAVKDVHLIDSAWQTESIVASMDEIARGIFVELIPLEPLLKGVAWVNPSRPLDEPIPWLRDNAKRKAHLRLGGKRRV